MTQLPEFRYPREFDIEGVIIMSFEMIDLNNDIGNLRVDDILKQTSTLDKLREFILLAVDEALIALQTTSHPLLLAEKIYRLL